MTRDELRTDNETTLAICEQVATPQAMGLLDWLHEDDFGAEGPTDKLADRLDELEATITSHRAAADALEAHVGRMRGWAVGVL